jgi:hypothetical protein
MRLPGDPLPCQSGQRGESGRGEFPRTELSVSAGPDQFPALFVGERSIVVTSLTPWRHDSHAGVSVIAGAVQVGWPRLCMMRQVFAAQTQQMDLPGQTIVLRTPHQFHELGITLAMTLEY